MGKPLILGALLAAVFIASPALAQTGQDLLRSGIAAFRAGDYAEARKQLERAQKAGVNRVSLHYNLGVTYYRLGEWAKAEAAFRKVATYPGWQAVAYYNLGLVALKAGDEVAATRWLERARATGDKSVAPLAEQLLGRGAAPAPSDSRWRGSVNLASGYDDNLLDPAEATATAESDTFVELFATLGRSLGRSGSRVDVGGYLARYSEFDDYDLNLLRAEYIHALPLESWRGELSARIDQSTLGGEDYLRQSALGVTGRRSVGRASLRLSYRLNRIEGLESIYDPQTGWQHSAAADARWKWSGRDLRLAYLLEWNDREDLEEIDSFTSYSPLRHRLSFGVRQPLRSGWEVGAEAGVRWSRYADPNRFVDGTSETREDIRNWAGISLARRLSERWELRLDYTATDNDSNIDDYDYQQHLSTLSLAAAF